ncbi:hypothetical protein OAL32_01195 [Synechococcus sp. AH-551-G15]|nr:hypothetical protein [Synechococcus sp. AH-551-G15]
MTTNFRLEHIKFFALVAYISYLVAILLSATSYNEGSIITKVSALQLTLSSLTSLIVPLMLSLRRGGIKLSESSVWIFLAMGFAFLAMDDSFTFHERLDYAIHSAFGWEETRLSDRIDDVIVGIYAIIGAIFVFYSRRYFSFSKRFLNFAKYSLAMAFLMVACDFSPFFSLPIQVSQYLAHLEEWAKIFGGAFLLIGLLCALEDASKNNNSQNSAID